MATSRDGLVGYDAALTQLRSGVRFPLFVACSFLSFSPQRCSSFASPGGGEAAEVCRGPINFVCKLISFSCHNPICLIKNSCTSTTYKSILNYVVAFTNFATKNPIVSMDVLLGSNRLTSWHCSSVRPLFGWPDRPKSMSIGTSFIEGC